MVTRWVDRSFCIWVIAWSVSACATTTSSSDPLSAWSGADPVNLSSGREAARHDANFHGDDEPIDQSSTSRAERRFLPLPSIASVFFETERPEVLSCNAENTLAETVDRYMRAQRPRVHACYTNLLRSDRQLAGTIRVQLRVNPDGLVQANIADNRTGSTSLAGCIQNVLERGQLSCLPVEAETFVFPLVFDG